MIDLSGEDGRADLLGDLAGPARASQSLAFSDYAIVVQAALLGQGVALGWLNVVAHWLREGALVPAAPRLRVTGRLCHLVRLKTRPASPAVEAVRDWIAAEMATEIAAIDAGHPSLGLARSIRDRE